MKRLSALIAIVMLVAIPGSVSLAKEKITDKYKRVVVPCSAKTDEPACTDDPDCKWNAKKSKCNKTHEGKDRCSEYESEFYCEANKCNWHRLATKCSTKPSRDY